jgi:hypothetical protein
VREAWRNSAAPERLLGRSGGEGGGLRGRPMRGRGWVGRGPTPRRRGGKRGRGSEAAHPHRAASRRTSGSCSSAPAGRSPGPSGRRRILTRRRDDDAKPASLTARPMDWSSAGREASNPPTSSGRAAIGMTSDDARPEEVRARRGDDECQEVERLEDGAEGSRALADEVQGSRPPDRRRRRCHVVRCDADVRVEREISPRASRAARRRRLAVAIPVSAGPRTGGTAPRDPLEHAVHRRRDLLPLSRNHLVRDWSAAKANSLRRLPSSEGLQDGEMRIFEAPGSSPGVAPGTKVAASPGRATEENCRSSGRPAPRAQEEDDGEHRRLPFRPAGARRAGRRSPARCGASSAGCPRKTGRQPVAPARPWSGARRKRPAASVAGRRISRPKGAGLVEVAACDMRAGPWLAEKRSPAGQLSGGRAPSSRRRRRGELFPNQSDCSFG